MSRLRSTILAAASALALLPFSVTPSAAQHHDDRHGGHDDRHDNHRGPDPRGRDRVIIQRSEPHWGGADIRVFRDRDFGLWRGGRWFNGVHSGRRGWWWIVGGVWYYYPSPVYPYPDPYRPPVVAGPAPAGQYYYYCANPAGYYPYVAQCQVTWQAVPANAAVIPTPSPYPPPP